MGKVAEIADFRPHNTASMRCMSCGHEWQSVASSPDPMVYVECPECGCDGGMKQGMCEIPGADRWECHCGCQAFEIYAEHGTFCINCGQAHTW